MRTDRGSLLSDVAFLLLLLLCFVCIVFVAGDAGHYAANVILLNAAFLIALLTFFTSPLTGLILNIVFIFGYGTFTLYRLLVSGAGIGAESYFWLFMTPAFTAAAWLLTQSNKRLQEEVRHLRAKNASLVMVDESTSLKNMRSFQADATVFMAISARYGIPLTLLVLSPKYWDDLKRIVGESELHAMIADISRINEASIRANDSLYMLNSSTPMWGLLLFTDREGAKVVIRRLKEKVEAINLGEGGGKYRVELQLRVGAAEYDAEDKPSPLEFVALARKQMEYDV